MVDHLAGHAAVDADVFAGDEARLVRAEEQHHAGDVQRGAHPPGGLLSSVRAGPYRVAGLDPARGDAVHPHSARKAHRQGVGQRRDAAFGRGVALGLGLAHPVPGGGDVHHRRPGRKVGREQLGEIEGGGHSHPQSIVELLVAALVDAFHQGQSVVDEIVHMAVVRQYFAGKLDSIDPSPAYELPVASSTVLGGIKVGANLAITDDGVLSATGGGGTGVSLPAHTVGANDDNPLVHVDPVIQSGNIILRTTYKDYASDGSTSQKQDDSTIFPTATSERPGVMSTTDKVKLDGMPDASTIATKAEIQTVQTNLTEFEGELISDPSALVGLASSAHAGLMSTGDKTKLDGMPASGDIALKSELSALTGELMNTPADVVGMATGTAGGLMSAMDKVKMDAIPSADTIATDSDIADIQNQISGLKLSEVSPNGIMLNGDSVTAVRSVAGSVSGSDLTINVNGVASQPIALPASGGKQIIDFDNREDFINNVLPIIEKGDILLIDEITINLENGSQSIVNGNFIVNDDQATPTANVFQLYGYTMVSIENGNRYTFTTAPISLYKNTKIIYAYYSPSLPTTNRYSNTLTFGNDSDYVSFKGTLIKY